MAAIVRDARRGKRMIGCPARRPPASRSPCRAVFAASGTVAPVDPALLQAKGSLFFTRPTLAHYAAERDELLERSSELFGWIRAGELSVRVGARYPLERAADAHRDLEARLTTGKSLIVPG